MLKCSISFLILCLVILFIMKVRYGSLQLIAEWCISPFSSPSFCFLYLEVLLLSWGKNSWGFGILSLLCLG